MNDLAADDQRFMAIALEEAEDAAARAGDVPVGAVVVVDGVILGRGRNRREVDGDPTAHAEVDALNRRHGPRPLARRRKPVRNIGTVRDVRRRASECSVSRLIYGAFDPKAGAVHSRYGIGLGKALSHTFSVSSVILAEESSTSCKRSFADCELKVKNDDSEMARRRLLTHHAFLPE